MTTLYDVRAQQVDGMQRVTPGTCWLEWMYQVFCFHDALSCLHALE